MEQIFNWVGLLHRGIKKNDRSLDYRYEISGVLILETAGIRQLMSNLFLLIRDEAQMFECLNADWYLCLCSSVEKGTVSADAESKNGGVCVLSVMPLIPSSQERCL